MIFDKETIIEIEDYIQALDENVGLKIETIRDIAQALNKQRKLFKNCSYNQNSDNCIRKADTCFECLKDEYNENVNTPIYYQKEYFPEHIKYIRDTDEIRILIENRLGKPYLVYDNHSYIEINLQENTWKTCMDFQWLYRDKPPCISIEELDKYISK